MYTRHLDCKGRHVSCFYGAAKQPRSTKGTDWKPGDGIRKQEVGGRWKHFLNHFRSPGFGSFTDLLIQFSLLQHLLERAPAGV